MSSPYPEPSTPVGRFVQAVMGCRGLPYRWGGGVPADGGMDCSGLPQYGFLIAGIEPWKSKYPGAADRTAFGLWRILPVPMRSDHTSAGWTAYYGRRDSGGGIIAISHVVAVVRVEPGGFVSECVGASRGHKGLVDPEEARKKGAVVLSIYAKGLRPAHLYRTDFIGFRMFPVSIGGSP